MPKTQSKNRKNSSPQTSMLRNPAVLITAGVLVVLVIVGFVMFGGGSPKSTGLAAEINVSQAYKLYQEKGAFFVDVREQEEWDSFHVPGTTLIPLGQLASRLSEVPKDQPVVVICRSGNRSQSGRDILLQAGYTNVTSMDGGVNDWKTNGYPIEP